jgi:hypothetical protein
MGWLSCLSMISGFAGNLRIDMKRTDRIILSSLCICLVFFMTSCQPGSFAKKNKVDTIEDVEGRFERNLPSFEVTSDTAEADKTQVIFKGATELKRYDLITFFADSISIERLGDDRVNYLIKMKGNVTMTFGNFFIKGEEALSFDFKTYVDFVGNVCISKYGPDYRMNWVRYYFPQGDLYFKPSEAPPMRG